uniref:Uncharacterized protein n=1 Tax=Nelumbo nucifera TaxID=4432 RepID=A0A822ZJG5_NELNU|nr:TPA_asm: hypothetical protein HUJ06_004464 [Nelumbo nucifera]
MAFVRWRSRKQGKGERSRESRGGEKRRNSKGLEKKEEDREENTTAAGSCSGGSVSG